jgi:hypothetical protein
MRKILVSALIWIMVSGALAAENELRIEGKRLVSTTPFFLLTLPRPFQLVHSSSREFAKESSRTRAYLLITERSKQVMEILGLEIADRTNPAAEPMALPPLVGENEARTYDAGKLSKENNEVQYLVQLITWSRDAPSLQPIVKSGYTIASHLALQGLLLFSYGPDHGILLRYSRDVTSLGLEVGGKRDEWRKASISGNRKRALDAFTKDFKSMLDFLSFKRP